MPSNEELKNQARAKARSILSKSQSFRDMDRDEQMELYQTVVNQEYKKLAQQNELATGMAAGDAIDPERHINTRIASKDETAGQALSKFKTQVDFPGFVRDLLVGVFDANLDANKRQMDAFKELLREATKTVAQFQKEVDETDALIRIAQSNPDQYRFGYSSGRGRRPKLSDRGGQGQSNDSEEEKPTLLDTENKPIDLENNDIKNKIFKAKEALAKEKRTLLRETLLMGVSRLVVEKGTIRAKVKFKVDAEESTTNEDYAEEYTSQRNEAINTKEDGFRGGWRFLGGGYRRSESKISIATTDGHSDANSTTNTNTKLSAEMEGFVEIQFKSDYFKLDNFTQIFDLGEGQVAQGPITQPQTQPQQQLPTDGQ